MSLCSGSTLEMLLVLRLPHILTLTTGPAHSMCWFNCRDTDTQPRGPCPPDLLKAQPLPVPPVTPHKGI